MEMESGGGESESQLVCVYRCMVTWSESGIGEEAYESVIDIDGVKASDNDVVKGTDTSAVADSVSDFVSASSRVVDLENLDDYIALLTWIVISTCIVPAGLRHPELRPSPSPLIYSRIDISHPSRVTSNGPSLKLSLLHPDPHPSHPH